MSLIIFFGIDIFDQNSRSLEIGDKVNLTLVIKKRHGMLFYRTNNKKIYQKIWIFVIHQKSIQQVQETIFGRCYKNRTRSFKNCDQKNKLIKQLNRRSYRNNIADKLLKTKLIPESNFQNVKEIIIPPEHREEILDELGQVL